MKRLWLRWSWRDLRRRWLLVSTIALVIGLGTGTYAALMSTSEWRRQSNDASFAALRTHDVRVRLGQGGTVAEGTLAGLVRRIPHQAAVDGVRERLVVPVQVAAPRDVLASGELVGTASGTATGTPADTGTAGGVDLVSRAAGRALSDVDDGSANVVLEQAFASRNGLPDRGELTLSGQVRAGYVGTGQSPEYFLVSGGQAALPFLSQKSYAVLFSSLHTAQRLAGAAGRVNDVVLTVRDPASATTVRAELAQAVSTLRPAVDADVTMKADLDSYRVLYQDISGDEQLWRVIALLVLIGAAFAALNLTTRVVEAQRREIGIGMALGVPGRHLAVRPLMFGAEVAAIGVAVGIAIGLLVGIPLRSVFLDMLPLPIWRTPFQPGVFAQAATLGFVLPFAAVAWPVWRSVRVEPVQAIRVGHLAARGGRATRRSRAVPLPGRSYRQIPVRNLFRTPRRTLLTTLGIAAAISTLVTTLGFLDTFNATLDRSSREVLHAAPERVAVSLRSFAPVDGDAVRAVRDLPQVGGLSTGLLVTATASAGSRSVDLATEVLRPGATWTPTLTAGTARGGIVLAAKAAADLGVTVGDRITLTHPRVAASGGLETARSTMRVAGLHPNPMRMFAYLDSSSATVFGLDGVTNLLTVSPSAGTDLPALRHALLAVPQVAAAEAGRTTVEGMRSSLEEFLGILRVAAVVTLLLALLIAFNTASIGMDERSREHATMLAFGLPVRAVLGMTTLETLLLGVAGTVVGLVGGYGLLAWMTASTIPAVMPEIAVTATVAGPTVASALLLGVGTVAAAPLLTLRRLRRTDIPSALRLVE